MKPIKLQIKSLILLFLLIQINNIHAQKDEKTKNVFMRVYDLEGKKISKGKVLTVTDSLLTLKSGSSSVKTLVNTIGYIKTKRAEGNNMFIGVVFGAAFVAVLGAATADPNNWLYGFTSAEGAYSGAILGAAGGVGIGGITILFKRSETYVINGDNEKWKVQKKMIENKKNQ